MTNDADQPELALPRMSRGAPSPRPPVARAPQRAARPRPVLTSQEAELPLERLSVRVDQAMAMTGLRRSWLFELMRNGEIERIKVGTMTLIPVASLKRFLERHRTASPQATGTSASPAASRDTSSVTQ